MSKWTVSDYVDSMRERTDKQASEKDYFGKGPLFRNVFETEDEARKFIRERAEKELENAIANVKKAEARVRKCNLKFGFRQ